MSSRLAFGLADDLDLNVELPQTTDKLVGIDLTHIIRTNELRTPRAHQTVMDRYRIEHWSAVPN